MNITFTRTSERYFPFANPSNILLGDAELTLTCEFRATNYFDDGGSPDYEGHCGIMLRADLDRLPAGPYRGHGSILGRVWRSMANRPPSARHADPRACIQMESWGPTSTEGGRDFEYLRRASGVAMRDGVDVKLLISSKRFQGEVYQRQAVWALDYQSMQYEQLGDTGDVRDNNWIMARNCSNFILFDVGTNDGRDYTLEFSNINVVERPVTVLLPDLRWGMAR